MKKIETTIIRLVLIIAVICTMLGVALRTSSSAIPPTTSGSACDGIDFNALQTGYIYHGSCQHYATGGMYETARKPVLWRGIAIETMMPTDYGLTMLSEYVLDWGNVSSSGSNIFNGSAMESKLENIYENMFDIGRVTARPAHLLETTVTFRLFTHDGRAEELTPTHTYSNNSATVNYPMVANAQHLYLPWAYIENHSGTWYNDVYLDANNDYAKDDEGKFVRDANNNFWLNRPNDSILETHTGYAASVATLHDGTAVEWWTRAASSSVSYNMLRVRTTGAVAADGVGNNYGCRPVARLDLSAILFASLIGGSGVGSTPDDGINYIANLGENRYKLTVLNETGLSLISLADSSGAIVNNDIRSISAGSSMALTAVTGGSTEDSQIGRASCRERV